MILAIVSVLAVVFFAAALLLALTAHESSGAMDRKHYAEDMAYLLWGEPKCCEFSSTPDEYGNVSLEQEGEAWRSTLCHGPDDCHN